jgi:hypothetical protein
MGNGEKRENHPLLIARTWTSLLEHGLHYYSITWTLLLKRGLHC